LLAQAQATGLTLEDYLQQLVERELYRTGKPLPAYVIDAAVRRSREERARHKAKEIGEWLRSVVREYFG